MENSREVLAALLDHECTADEAAMAVWQRKMIEDQWLDYKSGLELKKSPSERNHDLKSWVSGFANAEGGLLVYGVTEKDGRPLQVDGVPQVGRDSAHDWASRVLDSMAPQMSRVPLISQVVVDGQEVLLIATERAPNLVPVVVSRQLVHYLRVGDETPEIPQFLHADLALGRRQRPRLRIAAELSYIAAAGAKAVELRWTITVHNEGLVWVPQMQVGFTGPGEAIVSSSPSHPNEDMSPSLSTWLNPEMECEFDQMPRVLVDRSRYGRPLAPMEFAVARFRIQVPRAEAFRWQRWMGAAYVIPVNGAPLKAQLSARFKVGKSGCPGRGTASPASAVTLWQGLDRDNHGAPDV